MKHAKNPLARLVLAGGAALIVSMPVHAAIRAEQPLQEQTMPALSPEITSGDMPTADMAIGEEPYCADHIEIRRTLTHDFSEDHVDSHDPDGTELWGSAQMGTWTLVEPMRDGTSCIIASGTGFDGKREAETYYFSAGLE
ncbi:hypothetical protein JJJ17_16840 [Paracoccus caeni]|uniref:Uncharacterized protein n=1 Tax=Paracoccus caeni TaxID=657651 RepID=A0A934SHK9_9RHOB|nr:hypothetical protein [Paracoccus caeni]MBK4217599.1 hypothetical protein [Paracoccus caeni]